MPEAAALTPRCGADAEPKALSPEQKAEQAAEAKAESSRDVLISKVLHELSHSHQRTQEVFLKWDEDGSGAVGAKEFFRGLKALGVTENLTHLKKCKKADIDALFALMDVDGNGELDYEEFIAATLCASKTQNEDNMERAFAYFDKDNSGFITIDELRKVIDDFGLSGMSDAEFMKEVDANNDGKIEYDEFLRFMSKR